jgi:mono/diheme cytochrome c family protein
MRIACLLLGLLLSPLSLAADGKALHDAACLQCHASLGGGDAHQLYTRDKRTVKSLDGLQKRVKNCMLAADVQWDKAQQQAVVNYLNKSFYRF